MRTGKTAAKITHGRAEGVNHSLIAKFRRKKGRRGYVNVRKEGARVAPLARLRGRVRPLRNVRGEYTNQL